MFRGRLQSAIRFRKGDIVEAFDCIGKSRFVIIYDTPPSVEEGYEINKRLNDLNKNISMDITNDSYTVIDGPGYDYH